MISRPVASEYVPYFRNYIELAEDDPLAQLERQIEEFARFVQLVESRASLAPAPGEWSVKEVLVHLCDFERMFAYRALRFSRGDSTPVEAFEQDPYVAASGANGRRLPDIVAELVALRRSTIQLFGSFTTAMFDAAGTAGGNPVTVRALVFIIPGHSEGHLQDLRRLTIETNAAAAP